MIEIITIDDVRSAGLCVSGTRKWFATYNLDFRDFLKNGIEAEKLLATEDGHALRVVAVARERRNG